MKGPEGLVGIDWVRSRRIVSKFTSNSPERSLRRMNRTNYFGLHENSILFSHCFHRKNKKGFPRLPKMPERENNSRNFWWGWIAQFLKPIPYFRPVNKMEPYFTTDLNFLFFLSTLT